MTLDTGKALSVRPTAISGLLLIDLPVHGDNRGWFKENWQREKFVALGVPDFGPVQNNVSFNDAVGTTRGVHAEPWDKYVSVASGRIFGAWVDLREGPGFGTVFTAEMDPSVAVFVPRGVGNGYQTLEPATAYTYLVNDHWTPEASYTFLNLADETSAIPWPIPLGRAELSAKDIGHPRLADVVPIPPRRTLVLGADGQLGRALRVEFPDAEFAGRAEFDLEDAASFQRRWRDYGVVINAAAFTGVDAAETPEGRARAWEVNAVAPGRLARIAADHGILLVTVSTDYVFDGTRDEHHEDEPLTPLGVYGQSKAAGDVAVTAAPRHYVVRTSWVVGEGKNFLRTMADLASRGVDPAVVDDQFGRLTLAADLAFGIRHLVRSGAPYGVYNLSNSGPTTSWFEVAREVFSLVGADPGRVTPVSTDEYFAGRSGVAPRPRHSTLALDKITSVAGFRPRPAREALAEYFAEHRTERVVPDRPWARRVLVALGGNAMSAPDGSATESDQIAALGEAAGHIADLVAAGIQVVVTHGNGPQVGNLLVKNELSAAVVPPVSLDWCVAGTQATIGFVLQDALSAAFRERGLDTATVTLVSRTVVDPDDQAFGCPDKPIGRYRNRAEAAPLIAAGQHWRDFGDRGWRRVVASPRPLRCLDSQTGRTLADLGYVVILSGGGGIPVVQTDSGWSGVEAVIDKDRAAAILGPDLGADALVIATDVDAAVVGFGTQAARAVGHVSVAQMREYSAAGHFAAGSMGPKVDALCAFVGAGGRAGIITRLDRLAEAVTAPLGTVGTVVTASGPA